MDDRPRPGLSWSKKLGWLLSLLALGFVGRWLWQLDRLVWRDMRQLDPYFLAIALCLFIIWFLTRFFLWRYIIHRHGYRSKVGQNLRLWALSEFMRYIPGNVWSFAARWRGSVESGVTKSGATQSLILEALGLVGGATLFIALTIRPSWWWMVLFGLAIYVFGMPIIFRRLQRRLHPSDVQPIRALEVLGLTIGYVGSWFFFGLAHGVLWLSFPNSSEVSIREITSFSVLAWLLGYLSLVTPMGLGVREASFVGLLRATNRIDLGLASLFTVVSRVWLIVSELVFVGLVVLLIRKKSSSP